VPILSNIAQIALHSRSAHLDSPGPLRGCVAHARV